MALLEGRRARMQAVRSTRGLAGNAPGGLRCPATDRRPRVFRDLRQRGRDGGLQLRQVGGRAVGAQAGLDRRAGRCHPHGPDAERRPLQGVGEVGPLRGRRGRRPDHRRQPAALVHEQAQHLAGEVGIAEGLRGQMRAVDQGKVTHGPGSRAVSSRSCRGGSLHPAAHHLWAAGPIHSAGPRGAYRFNPRRVRTRSGLPLEAFAEPRLGNHSVKVLWGLRRVRLSGARLGGLRCPGQTGKSVFAAEIASGESPSRSLGRTAMRNEAFAWPPTRS